MNEKGTLMPDGGLLLAGSAIAIKARRTQGKSPVMQVLIQDVKMPRGLSFPEGAYCVLEASRTRSGNIDRIEVGRASDLPAVCPDWIDLPMMPVDEEFLSATRFRFKVVGADRRVLAVAEGLRCGGDGSESEATLLDFRVLPHASLGGLLADISPEWDGKGPVPVRISNRVPNAEARLERDDFELYGLVLSTAVPQILMRLFVEFDESCAAEGRALWGELMRGFGISKECVERLSDASVEIADKVRFITEVSRELTGHVLNVYSQEA